MSHIALARKWRPQRFDDVIGQRGVIETMRNALVTGRLAQAFIFAGPRGVGKTTTARIVARALNCVNGPTPDPCGVCDACVEIAEGRDVDVLEIDGATYTGVDAVREVIVEPLSISPMRDRYKIFIIDEVHRLSKNAFDALLKSIEEPPPYVKFMMATTDLHAVPPTIQSRSQVFELKALSSASIRDQLTRVIANEAIDIDDGAVSLIARSAEGSMRDALSALDQVLAFSADRITTTSVSTVLGLIGRDQQFEIVETVAREEASAVFGLAGRVVEAGFDLRIVCRELARLVRDLMVVKIDASRLSDPEIAALDERERLQALAAQFSPEDLLRAFDLLSRAEYDVRQSSQPRQHFEMALLKWIHLRKLTPLSELLAKLESGAPAFALGASAVRPAVSPVGSAVRPAAPPVSGPPVAKPSAVSPAAVPSSAPAGKPAAPVASGDFKAALLAAVLDQNKMLYRMVIAQAQSIEVDRDALVLTFAPAHKSLKAQLDGKRAWLEQLATQTAGRKIAVITRDGPPAAPAATVNPADAAAAGRQADLRARAKAAPTVQAVLDVFGGDIEDVEEI